MPLHVQFLRNGIERVDIDRFGHWHLGIALTQGAREQARILGAPLPDVAYDVSLGDMTEAQKAEWDRESRLGWMAFASGKCVITEDIAYRDPTDGEVVEFLPGDSIRMWR